MYKKSYNRKLCTGSLTTGSYVQEVLQQEAMYRKSYNRKSYYRKLCTGSFTTGSYVQEVLQQEAMYRKSYNRKLCTGSGDALNGLSH